MIDKTSTKKVVVDGREDFYDYDVIIETLDQFNPTHIIAAMDKKGPAAYAEPYARLREIPITLFPRRDVERWRILGMVAQADLAVIFGDLQDAEIFDRAATRKTRIVVVGSNGEKRWLPRAKILG